MTNAAILDTVTLSAARRDALAINVANLAREHGVALHVAVKAVSLYLAYLDRRGGLLAHSGESKVAATAPTWKSTPAQRIAAGLVGDLRDWLQAHGDHACPAADTFDPYAYGFAKVSALEGEGSH